MSWNLFKNSSNVTECIASEQQKQGLWNFRNLLFTLFFCKLQRCIWRPLKLKFYDLKLIASSKLVWFLSTDSLIHVQGFFYTLIHFKSLVRFISRCFCISAHKKPRSARAGLWLCLVRLWIPLKDGNPNLSRQQVPKFDHAPNKKDFFLMFELNFWCFNLCP